MEFRSAGTSTDSLSRLTAQEQKAVKTAAFDLQLDASAPGLSLHKLDRAKDPNFWSVRVNADIRLTAHYGATEQRPFDVAVVDEAQDIGVAEARFLAAFVSPRPDGLLITGVDPASEFLDDLAR